ncbi:MAG TPA: hypothetical protein VK689_22120 [Armatimonadota bacterium]|nr:hypothetical protein [Armatimonadota bacterium]
MRFFRTYFIALVFAAAGCAQQSPLVGTWTVTAQLTLPPNNPAMALAGAMAGPQASTLVLNPDGTGTFRVAGLAERAVTWKEEGDRVVLRNQAGAKASSNAPAAGGDVVGNLSSDKQTLTVTLSVATATLKKQPNP